MGKDHLSLSTIQCPEKLFGSSWYTDNKINVKPGKLNATRMGAIYVAISNPALSVYLLLIKHVSTVLEKPSLPSTGFSHFLR